MKKRSGGRVTPKGTQPPGSAAKRDQEHEPNAGPPRALPGRPEAGHGRAASGPVGPTRSGHHRGNR
jgi:hypothetical protein